MQKMADEDAEQAHYEATYEPDRDIISTQQAENMYEIVQQISADLADRNLEHDIEADDCGYKLLLSDGQVISVSVFDESNLLMMVRLNGSTDI